MDGEQLLGHVENLVPGFVTIAIAATRIPAGGAILPNETIRTVLQQPFVAGVLLTAIAYLCGTLSFVLSRWPIDTISALTFRPIFLKFYRWKDFRGRSPLNWNRIYRQALDEALKQPADSPIRQEVARRRQRGRLIRTVLIPTLVLAWPFARPFATPALILLGVVALYAYAEVTIYQEARLAA